MAEWSKAPVLKTGEVHASVGSNPTPSAINSTCHRRTMAGGIDIEKTMASTRKVPGAYLTVFRDAG
jgi:hypothetical protein